MGAVDSMSNYPDPAAARVVACAVVLAVVACALLCVVVMVAR